MKVLLPKGKYVKTIEVNDDGLEVKFAKKQKIALLFIGLNERYWPYLAQAVEDCKTHFLPQHNVDYLLWTDIPQTDTPEFTEHLDTLLTEEQLQAIRVNTNTAPNNQFFSKEAILHTIDVIRNTKGLSIFPTEPVDWPAPTLMRYHLFLQQEEKLKEYDYVFYLDADMRVVEKISDEILGEGITAAEHPMYSLRPNYIPPFEPNKDSTAYIHRLGEVVDENGKPRFKPYYVAGGFQGGKTKAFIKAMKVMRENIDVDFNKNYIAIWNDESHWNKYLWDFYKGDLKVLSPSYIYPDSLIKEYYEPIWGKSYQPKIITLTKPFSLSKQAGNELNQFLGNPSNGEVPQFKCSQCESILETPGHTVLRVVTCQGKGQPHQLEMKKI